jgi:acetamidase/formamidase
VGRSAARVIHELPLERRTLHGYFSRDLPPVLSIDPGDSVRFKALNSGWRWEADREFLPERDAEHLDSGHALCGPIEVRGARAGQTLTVRIDELRPGPWGVTFGDGQAFPWRIDADAGTATDDRGATVALAPFLGVIGMPLDEPGIWSTVPPRRPGGNVDCRLLVAGTTLLLPIEIDRALLSVGDGHAAQGDGEVSGTAIECPLASAQVTLDLREDLDLRMPIARTHDAWIAFGFDEDLDVAATLATETMLDLIERELATDRKHALALASVAVDLAVTQLVNRTKGVHAILRDDAIRIPGIR